MYLVLCEKISFNSLRAIYQLKPIFVTGLLLLVLFNCKKVVVETEMPDSSDGVLPADVIDLTNWKITIPFDASGIDGGNSGVAAEVKQPLLNSYELPVYYYVNETKDGVIFRAHAGGAHTSGSGYPRCELREMTNDGKDRAKWQSAEGVHRMEIVQAINAIPTNKKHVVAGQIHSTGDFDDVITCRLENKKLFLSHNGKDGATLTTNYVLGTRFKIEWVVENNETKTFFNDELVETYSLAFPDAYFKAGCYTQSASWGKNNNHNANASEYGEVVIYNVTTTHS